MYSRFREIMSVKRLVVAATVYRRFQRWQWPGRESGLGRTEREETRGRKMTFELSNSCSCSTHKGEDIRTDRQTGRQTQTHTQTHRYTDSKIDRQTDKWAIMKLRSRSRIDFPSFMNCKQGSSIWIDQTNFN